MPIPSECRHGIPFDALFGCKSCMREHAAGMKGDALFGALLPPAAPSHVEVHTCPVCSGKGHVAVVEGR